MALVITDVSHLDHGITGNVLSFLLDKYKDKNEFFIECLEFSERFSCGLYGPKMGDVPVLDSEVVMKVRGERGGESRMVNRPMRLVNWLTVIAGPHDGQNCVLYTAFGGLPAPREPWDSEEMDEDQFLESCEFWSKHALSLDDDK